MNAPVAAPDSTDLDAGKNVRLVKRLVAKTRTGELDWRPGVDGTTFQLDLPPGVLFISRDLFEEDDRVGVHYQLDICDEEGFPAESVNADYDRHREDGPLVELYEAARGRARGSQKIVDGLLNALGGGD